MRPAWFPDWRSDICVIVASGPSAVEQPIHLARGVARVIVVNQSWHLAPWADVLYASDAIWWQSGAGNDFCGLKVSRSDHPGVEKVSLRKTGHDKWHDEIIYDALGEVGSGGNGGFQALNLAVQFGAFRIALVGFDMMIENGKHWHGDHIRPLSNPENATVARWRDHMERAALSLSQHGVEVYNCSSKSALQRFPKLGLAEWLVLQSGCQTMWKSSIAPRTRL